MLKLARESSVWTNLARRRSQKTTQTRCSCWLLCTETRQVLHSRDMSGDVSDTVDDSSFRRHVYSETQCLNRRELSGP